MVYFKQYEFAVVNERPPKGLGEIERGWELELKAFTDQLSAMTGEGWEIVGTVGQEGGLMRVLMRRELKY